MEKKNNIRIVNGISGTTIRMMKTAKWLGLNGKDLMNFRLALMGWMLPTDDHSLWEIIIGSHNVGVKGKEDMTDMVSLDKTVDPLDEEKLRQNVCSREVKNEPMFPHEIVYWKQRYDEDDGEGYHKIAKEYRDEHLTEGSIDLRKGNLFDTAKEKDKREKEVVGKYPEIEKLLDVINYISETLDIFDYEFSNPQIKIGDKTIFSYKEEDLIKLRNYILSYTPGSSLDDMVNVSGIIIEYIKFIKSSTFTPQDFDMMIIKLTLPRIFEYISFLKENLPKLKTKAIEAIEKYKDSSFSLVHSPQKSAVLTYTSSDYKGINHAVQMVSSKGISRMIRKHALKNDFINKLVTLDDSKSKYDNSIKGFKSSLTQAKKSARQIYKNNKKSENMDVRKKARSKYKSNLKVAKNEYRKNIKKAKQSLEKTKKEAKDTFHEKRSDYDQYVKDSLVEANMINDSLLTAATSGNKPYEGTVYRGTKIPFISKYRKGGNYRIGTFTSTSKSVTKAKDFIGGVGGLKGIEKKVCYNVLQEVKLTGKHGVDLTSAGVGHDKDARYAMSIFGDSEQEVLNMPGAKWKITDVYENVPLDDYAGNGNISGIKNEAKKVKEKSSKEDYKNYCEQKKVGILVKMKEIG